MTHEIEGALDGGPPGAAPPSNSKKTKGAARMDEDDKPIEDEVVEDEGPAVADVDVGERIKLDASPEPEAEGAETPEPGDAEVAPTDAKKVGTKEVAAIRETKAQQKARLKALRDQQNASVSLAKAANAEARMKFLQQQVEVFSRFTGGEGPGSGQEKPAAAKKKKTEGGGRTRMTEEEEDQALMEAGRKGVRATRLTVQPGCIKGGQMRAYQIEGLNWMIQLYEQGINGILADEMGLGKTLQSISLLGYLKFERGVSGPHIVVVPKAVCSNWLREFAKWCPDLKVVHVHGTKEERAAQIRNDLRPGMFDVCVTTFEVLMIERAAFLKFEWRYMIVDEAHRLKSEKTNTARVVRELDTQFRLLVTGTPLQNNLHELWALLNFLLPEVFSDAALFEEYFKLEEMQQESVVSKLHAILRPFMIRRLKSDVEKNLPPKREIKLHTGLSEMQEYWYKTILNKDVAVLNQLGGPDRSRLLNILMQLRKVCNHPYLFTGAEPGPPYIDGPHIWENSGKLHLVDKLLNKLKKNGDRVLIFSQMTRMLDILEDYVRYKGYEYCRIDGSSKGEDRDKEMDAFNAPGSSKFVFLLSTRAGGLGINLATANVVILYDSDWNPQMDLQAQDRAHRIGQTKEVTVFRLVTEGTVEEKIVERAEKKLYLDAVVVQQGRLQAQNAALSKTELMTMVKFGAEAIFRAGGKRITDDDIDAILERDAKRTEETRERFKTDVQHNLLNFRLDAENAEASILLAGDNNNTPLGANFINLPARRGNTMVDQRQIDDDKEPTKPKGMTIFDFQFFDEAKIRAIEDQEYDWLLKRRVLAPLVREAKQRERKERAAQAYRERGVTPTTTPGPGEAIEGDDDDQDAPAAPASGGVMTESQRLQAEMDAMTIDEKTKAEKQRLIDEGFASWNRPNFRAYCNAVERFGRANIVDIANNVAEVTGKPVKEVYRYHQVFWRRYKEVEGWEKIVERVEKGEQKIARRQVISDLLKRKIDRTPNPWQLLTIEYGQNRGKAYTEDEDRFLVCAMHKFGHGNWDMIRQEIRKSWVFRFDWFFKSRSSLELQRRCDALIRMLEKEEEDMQATKKRKTLEEEANPDVKAAAAPNKRAKTTAGAAGDDGHSPVRGATKKQHA